MTSDLNDDLFVTPSNLLKKRVSSLREQLIIKGADGALILNPANIRYLSGFTGSTATLYISASRACLFTDFRYITQAKLESGSNDFGYEIIRIENNYQEPLSDLLRTDSVKNILIEGDFVTFPQYEDIIRKLPVETAIDMGDLVTSLRAIKDQHEISLMQEAADIADRAFLKILEFVKPGISEKDLSDELEYYLNRAGAYGTSFDTIAVSGYRTAMPHGKPGTRKLESKDIITLDFGAKYRSYCSDMTRTFFIGKPDDTLLKIYNIVNEARSRAIDAAIGNIIGKDLDSVARNHIVSQGYGDYFGHGTGHGVGIEIHEEPRVSPRFTDSIPVGAVVTIEPGIYIEGLGGVRIEDMILMTETGCKLLTHSKRDLICL